MKAITHSEKADGKTTRTKRNFRSTMGIRKRLRSLGRGCKDLMPKSRKSNCNHCLRLEYRHTSATERKMRRSGERRLPNSKGQQRSEHNDMQSGCMRSTSIFCMAPPCALCAPSHCLTFGRWPSTKSCKPPVESYSGGGRLLLQSSQLQACQQSRSSTSKT